MFYGKVPGQSAPPERSDVCDGISSSLPTIAKSMFLCRFDKFFLAGLPLLSQ